jgi:hypothetical protein
MTPQPFHNTIALCVVESSLCGKQSQHAVPPLLVSFDQGAAMQVRATLGAIAAGPIEPRQQVIDGSPQ